MSSSLVIINRDLIDDFRTRTSKYFFDKYFCIKNNQIIIYHDYFNIIFCLIISILNLSNWSFNLINWEIIWKGDYIYHIYYLSIIYFIIDLFYLILFPFINKNNKYLIIHHINCLLCFYVIHIIGIEDIENKWILSIDLLSEINVLFLVLKKRLSSDLVTDNKINCYTKYFVNMSFYLSWLIIRIILFPYISYIFILETYQEYKIKNNIFNCYYFYSFILQTLFCYFNLVWTYIFLSNIFNKYNFRIFKLFNNKSHEIHDYLNIVIMIYLSYMNLLNWKIIGNEIIWFGLNNYIFFNSSILYFIFDLCWVVKYPLITENRKSIIFHHINCIAGFTLFSLFANESQYWGVNYAMLAEINTLFLILRKKIPRNSNNFIIKNIFRINNLLFYASWIIIRLLIYPYLLLNLYYFYLDEYNTKLTRIYNPFLYCFFIHFSFCFLNFYWTFKLLSKNILLKKEKDS